MKQIPLFRLHKGEENKNKSSESKEVRLLMTQFETKQLGLASCALVFDQYIRLSHLTYYFTYSEHLIVEGFNMCLYHILFTYLKIYHILKFYF